MKLSQLQLNAFQQVAKAGSLTKASAILNLTQSALSHRLSNLEAELETALFVRHGTGVRLTEAGAKLLRYCQVQSQAEEELLTEIGPQLSKKRGTLAGTIRIAGTSSLMRSVVLPGIASLLRENPDIRVEVMTRELRELPRLMASGEAEFLVTSKLPSFPGLNEEKLGVENYVLVKGAREGSPANIYLDHDMEDQTTFDFLNLNSLEISKISRSFFDDIYGILDAAEEGLGCAVLPRHLIHRRKQLMIVGTHRPLKVPVFLYRQKQPYLTKLHQAFIAAILENAPRFLSAPSASRSVKPK